MAPLAEADVFDGLKPHPRLGEFARFVRSVAIEAASQRRAELLDRTRLEGLAAEIPLDRKEADTEWGNLIDVLESGAGNAKGRALASAVWAHAIALEPPDKGGDLEREAVDFIWLATHTPFDASSLVDRALGDAAQPLWEATANAVRRLFAGKLTPLGRGEALVGAFALAHSTWPSARESAVAIAREFDDPALSAIVASARETDAPVATSEVRVSGELRSPPRPAWTTALLALTGALFVVGAVRFIARIALAYRRPAEVTIDADGVRVVARTELLGRTLREEEFVVKRSALVRAGREVRFPNVAFYAGMIALATGSYVGLTTIVDGIRSASPPLLATGALIVAAGLGIDFVFSSVAPGTRGECRVIFVPTRGTIVCLANANIERADRALRALLAPLA